MELKKKKPVQKKMGGARNGSGRKLAGTAGFTIRALPFEIVFLDKVASKDFRGNRSAAFGAVIKEYAEKSPTLKKMYEQSREE